MLMLNPQRYDGLSTINDNKSTDTDFSPLLLTVQMSFKLYEEVLFLLSILFISQTPDDILLLWRSIHSFLCFIVFLLVYTPKDFGQLEKVNSRNYPMDSLNYVLIRTQKGFNDKVLDSWMKRNS